MVPGTLTTGAVFGAFAVGLGAFGAHALEGTLANSAIDQMEQLRLLNTWEVAVRYQMYHAFALLLCGLLSGSQRPRLLSAAAICFVVGTLIFSGCLYAYVLSGVKILGAIVPLGGTALIAGWVLLAVGVSGKKECEGASV